MELPLYVINAFTKNAFAGNPAAVIPLSSFLSDEIMLAVAAQNNLSETAFIVEQNGRYHIRWFSPKTEIAFCGHATLASAYVLFNRVSDLSQIKFYAKAVGEFTVTRGQDGKIAMTFPQRHIEPVNSVPEALLEGLKPRPQEVYVDEQAYYVCYPSEDDVRSATYDYALIASLAPLDVCVTSTADNFDFVSRYFWPANGGDEDPTTGSAHTSLAPFWSKKLGKDKLEAFQASSRGGEVSCSLQDAEVVISGYAAPYLEGTITI